MKRQLLFKYTLNESVKKNKKIKRQLLFKHTLNKLVKKLFVVLDYIAMHLFIMK